MSEISNEDAIQRLRQIEHWQNATDESREGEDRDADYLLATKGIDWLKEMFAAERVARQAAERERDELRDGWIACSERMPEAKALVLVCEGAFITTAIWECDQWWGHNLLWPEISHWRPLPHPPPAETETP